MAIHDTLRRGRNGPANPQRRPHRNPGLWERIWRQNSLSIVLLSLFALSWAGQMLAGFEHYVHELGQHGLPGIPFWSYLSTGDFLEATAENWESEFLQMSLYVVLTSFLRQKGSAESKKLTGANEVDEDPHRHRNDPDAPSPVRKGGWRLAIYRNSLSLALFTLFAAAFLLHAYGGAAANCEQNRMHKAEPCQTAWKFFADAEFWSQSFQNWQSEFFSIAILVVFSIYLRQYGSPNSKPVHWPHSKTGG